MTRRTSISWTLPSRFGGVVAKQVLAVELVGDAGERGGEVLAEADLGVAAAGLLGDARQAGIGEVGDQHRAERARADAWRLHRTVAAAAHADGVDHDASARARSMISA